MGKTIIILKPHLYSSKYVFQKDLQFIDQKIIVDPVIISVS